MHVGAVRTALAASSLVFVHADGAQRTVRLEAALHTNSGDVLHDVAMAGLGLQIRCFMDVAAEVMGLSLLRTKLQAFAISSFYCCVGGALFAFAYLQTIEPSGFNIELSFRNKLQMVAELTTYFSGELELGKVDDPDMERASRQETWSLIRPPGMAARRRSIRASRAIAKLASSTSRREGWSV